MYQRFVYDLGLYIYGAIWIALLIFLGRNDLLSARHGLYFGFSFAGLGLAIWIHKKRDRTGRLLPINFNYGQTILIGVQFLVLILIYFKYASSVEVVNWEYLSEEIMVASWENCAFGLLAVYFLLKICRVDRIKDRNKELSLMFGVIAVCSLGFSLAHFYVYGGDPVSIASNFGMGLLMMSICYSFSPSLSFTLHLANNMIFAKRLVGGE
jgi:hypothetical protein